MPKDQAYLLAEQKIAEALKTGATELDLRDSGDSHLQGDCHLHDPKVGHHAKR